MRLGRLGRIGLGMGINNISGYDDSEMLVMPLYQVECRSTVLGINQEAVLFLPSNDPLTFIWWRNSFPCYWVKTLSDAMITLRYQKAPLFSLSRKPYSRFRNKNVQHSSLLKVMCFLLMCLLLPPSFTTSNLSR